MCSWLAPNQQHLLCNECSTNIVALLLVKLCTTLCGLVHTTRTPVTRAPVLIAVYLNFCDFKNTMSSYGYYVSSYGYYVSRDCIDNNPYTKQLSSYL